MLFRSINEAKAKVLYDYLDSQDFYNNPVEHPCRCLLYTSLRPAARLLWAAGMIGAAWLAVELFKGRARMPRLSLCGFCLAAEMCIRDRYSRLVSGEAKAR